jgi:PAS domain S-box-containing protein
MTDIPLDTASLLIVEDEVIIAEHIQTNLQEFGYHVCGRATSGEEAFEKAVALKPDLVLMDIRLKGSVDGVEAALNIRKQLETPIIFLTAYADKVLLERAKPVKPAGYLIKPIQKQMLHATIEMALFIAQNDAARRKAEGALKDSEERWRSLTWNSLDLIIELDQDLLIRFLNRPLPGLEVNAMIGCSLLEMLELNDSNARIIDIFREVLQSSTPSACEVSYRTAEGTTIVYEARVSPQNIVTKKGRMGLIVTLRDLTSFREVSKKLLDRERWLKSTFEQAAVGIVHYDLIGNFLRINQTYCDIMGFSEAELLGKNTLDVTSMEYHEEQLAGRARLLSGELNSFSNETKNIRKDGSPIWINLTISLVREMDDKPEYFMGIVEDISERKKIERALQENEQKYRSLVENIPQRVYLKNERLEYIAVNNNFAGDFGRHPLEFEGKTDSDLFPENQAQQIRAQDQATLDSGKITEAQEPLSIKGRPRTIEIVRIPKKSEDGLGDGILGVYSDITDRLESEKTQKVLEDNLRQTQKMYALGTLAGGVAHDFNNILHPIIGLSTLGTRLNDKGTPNHRYFSDIQRAGKRAKELVGQILTFSRQGEQSLKPLKLQPLIRESLKMLRASLPVSIIIQTDISNTCGPINADPTQIHQVIMNLVTNAFQAMHETGGTLAVSLKQLDSVATGEADTGGSCACLTISDTGVGIPSKDVEKIFEPYFSTKGVGQGTGLGLSVVMGIVKKHDGTIQLDSKPGSGTEFSLCFPITTKLAVKNISLNPEKTLGNGENILVVDDEPEIIFFLSEALKYMGYSVRGCNSGLEALEFFKEDPDAFDLVITDMTMPLLSGLDLSKQMLKIRPGLPIILCTGYSEVINEEKATSSGIRKFLTKPIDQDGISAAIREILDVQPA